MTIKQKLENTAVRIAREKGVINLTKDEVCKAVGVEPYAFKGIMGETFTEMISRFERSGIGVGMFPVQRERVQHDLRAEQIMDHALRLAEEMGYYAQVTYSEVAESAGVSRSLMYHYFGPMEGFPEKILEAAIRRVNVPVIRQGINYGHRFCRDLPRDITRKLNAGA